METLLLTPTTNTTQGTQTGSEPPADRLARLGIRLYSLFQSLAGGFSFGIIAPLGAIPTKEVTITNKGIILHSSKIAFQFIRKDYIS